jgi:hypothetical protein
LAFFFGGSLIVLHTAAADEPAKILFDTDIENDVDDVGAVAVLHKLADRGEARILGMGVSVSHPWSAPCLDALNTYFGRPDTPIGVPKGKAPDTGSKYAQKISAEFPHRLASADAAPNVVTLYRQLLAGEPDQSVVLVSVGFLTNVANLIDSSADEASPLGGRALVAKKIKLWVAMAGQFPSGREWNVFQDTDASRRALADWPTPVVFSGFEIGLPVETGAALRAVAPNSPIRRSYELYNESANRSSWDQTAVLYAVRGPDERLANLWSLSKPGVIEIRADGSNDWRESADGTQTYLIAKAPPEDAAIIIESLMVEPPKKEN